MTVRREFHWTDWTQADYRKMALTKSPCMYCGIPLTHDEWVQHWSAEHSHALGKKARRAEKLRCAPLRAANT